VTGGLKSDDGQGFVKAPLPLPADVDEIVGDDAEANPALHSASCNFHHLAELGGLGAITPSIGSRTVRPLVRVASRRIEPISLSAYPFCQGDRAGDRSVANAMARMRRMKAAPYAPSRSRTK